MRLGQEAVEFSKKGYYTLRNGRRVDISQDVKNAIESKISIPPEAPLPENKFKTFPETTVQVTNKTTLGAAHRFYDKGLNLVALNFANGIHPGGGFLNGASAQEEVLCRSSALYLTLSGDPMYQAHRQRQHPDSTDWVICSPDVPVFRTDNGSLLEKPWLLSFLTCAAPYAPTVGQAKAGNILKQRIHRILAIMRSYGYTALVLGAWGCGAFGNEPYRTAYDFRQALETEFYGAFSDIVFAITDWSHDRRFIGPFCHVFAPDKK